MTDSDSRASFSSTVTEFGLPTGTELGNKKNIDKMDGEGGGKFSCIIKVKVCLIIFLWC